MEFAQKQFEQLVLVCVNEKDPGKECCGAKGAEDLHHALKMAVLDLGISARVTKTGCLGNCATGITVALMPQNIYYAKVKQRDIPEILEQLKKYHLT